MGPNHTSYGTDDQEDEPYCCRPTCDEDDVVCLGSDSEQTREEVAQKHQRYEAEAQRIIKGQLPVLQSASLRGPFEKGWVNPWRYRTTKKQDQEWWQPGSEDMLFTRAKVMERAAAHGLGYLKPADALEWCKAAARAEAEIMSETQIQSGQILRSVEQDGPDDSEEADDRSGSEASDEVPPKHRLARSASPRSPERPDLSMLNHYSETPNVEELNESRGNAKRPADLQWLKGSYVSKRARWEGPAAPSPTPFHDVLERDRRRRQLSARTFDKGKAKVRKPSRLSKSFNDLKEVPKHHLAPTRGPQMPQEIEQPRLGVISSFGPYEMTSLLDHEDFGHQADELDELQDSSLENPFQTAPQSSVKSRKIDISFDDRSLADLEQDDLVVITPRKKPNPNLLQNSTSSASHVLNTAPDDSYDLPRLLLRNITSNDHSQEEIYHQEDSFITDVAPSSRNLETFKFRKRRPKLLTVTKKQSVSGPGHDRRKMKSGVDSKHRDGQHMLSDTMRTVAEDRESMDVPTCGPASSYKVPLVAERPSLSSQTTPPKSDKDEAGGSGDDDYDNAAAPLLRLAAEPLQTTSPPKSRSSISISPYTTPNKRSQNLQHLSKPSHLFRDSRTHGTIQVEAAKTKVLSCSNDMSTQSFNTTSPRSTLSPVRQSFSLARGLFTQQPEAEAISKRIEMNEMDKIQLALSQACPSASLEDSPHASLARQSPKHSIGRESAVNEDVSEPLLPDNLEVTPSPVRSYRSPEGLVPGLPSIEFTDFANESFLYLGGYLSESIQTGALAPVGDASGAPLLSVSPEFREKFDDAPREDDASPVHSRLAHKNSQFSDERATSITIATEVQDDALEMSHLSLSHTPIAGLNYHDDNPISLDPVVASAEIEPSVVMTLMENQDGAIPDQEVSQMQPDQKAGLQMEGSQKHPEARAEPEEEFSQEQREAGAGPEEATYEKELEEKPTNDVDPTPIDIPEHQKQTPFDSIPQDVQNEAIDEDVTTLPTQISNLKEQADTENHYREHEIMPETDDDEGNDPATGSEASWQGCGPQSPWVAEKIEPLSRLPLSKQVDVSLLREEREAVPFAPFIEQDKETYEDVSWITIDRPSTPESQVIRPFKDFSTPTPSPRRHHVDLDDSVVDTQTLIDAATRNPWAGKSKSRSTGKARKRVSFGIMHLDDDVTSQQDDSRGLTPRSPPPAQAELSDEDEDIFHDGTMVTNTFRKHFMAVTRKRQFKRILPDKRSSQLDSSPTLLEAQAERFIDADHDIPVHQWSNPAKESPSRHLQTLNEPNTNVWNENEEDDTMLGRSFSPSPKEKMSVARTSFASFDMATALGEAGDFLEDWSVDTVLKNPRDSESARRVESNGMRRRRLFEIE